MATHSSILTGKFFGQRSLAGYRPWGCKELDTTEWLSTNSVCLLYLKKHLGRALVIISKVKRTNHNRQMLCVCLNTPPHPILGGERNGNPLQYSCLENPMDRGAWGVTVHGVTRIESTLLPLDARYGYVSHMGWCFISLVIEISSRLLCLNHLSSESFLGLNIEMEGENCFLLGLLKQVHVNVVYLGNHFGPLEEASMQWETLKSANRKKN